jgi:hypothetical protein
MLKNKLIDFVKEECTFADIDDRLNMFFSPRNLVINKTRSQGFDKFISCQYIHRSKKLCVKASHSRFACNVYDQLLD